MRPRSGRTFRILAVAGVALVFLGPGALAICGPAPAATMGVRDSGPVDLPATNPSLKLFAGAASETTDPYLTLDEAPTGSTAQFST